MLGGGIKKTFLSLFLIFAIILLFLPIFTSISNIGTGIIEKLGWYKFISDYIVPFETRTIAGILDTFGYQVEAAPKTVSIFREGKWESVWITWNCIGWQSIILFFITSVVGFQGDYTKNSKIEGFIIGLLGTIIVNIFRLMAVTWLIFNFNAIPAVVLHDYVSALVLLVWLFFFWWFSYKYVLIEQEAANKQNL